ncbi:hypothetical protein ZIOFF_007657 [Zingiber officinale]|uniref:Uncharacterized protein n=1 Tax=Zingiber officinale TaxID=94328 RepID=A0A8J5I5C9_ZINOF|nr:hypothetical protein ZIOFF_007657 [Zingiber officinale]
MHWFIQMRNDSCRDNPPRHSWQPTWPTPPQPSLSASFAIQVPSRQKSRALTLFFSPSRSSSDRFIPLASKSSACPNSLLLPLKKQQRPLLPPWNFSSSPLTKQQPPSSFLRDNPLLPHLSMTTTSLPPRPTSLREETIMEEGKFDSNEMKDNTDHVDQDLSPFTVEEVKLSEIGMIFSSEEEIRTFYNSYATSVGFGILKLGEVQQLGAESDEICSVLVEIMKGTKKKLIIAMENGQSRAGQLEEASTSGAKVIHSPLKVVFSARKNIEFSGSFVEERSSGKQHSQGSKQQKQQNSASWTNVLNYYRSAPTVAIHVAHICNTASRDS